METRKKLVIILIAVIAVVAIIVIGSRKLFKRPATNVAPTDTQQSNEKVIKEPESSQETASQTTGTETDAITGTVTEISGNSITVENSEGKKTLNLYENIDTYSIDLAKGLIVRNISEVKEGTKVTVDYNVGSKIAKYVVIEK